MHDRCLLQWLLSGRENQESCELCTAVWEGDLTVAIRDLLAAAAALKSAQPDTAELVAAVAALQQREASLQRLLQEAEEAEAARQRDFERMRRVAAADREVRLVRSVCQGTYGSSRGGRVWQQRRGARARTAAAEEGCQVLSYREERQISGVSKQAWEQQRCCRMQSLEQARQRRRRTLPSLYIPHTEPLDRCAPPPCCRSCWGSWSRQSSGGAPT